VKLTNNKKNNIIPVMFLWKSKKVPVFHVHAHTFFHCTPLLSLFIHFYDIAPTTATPETKLRSKCFLQENRKSINIFIG